MDCQATLSISATQCDPTSATTPLHWSAPATVHVSCPAKHLAPQQRQVLAIQVLDWDACFPGCLEGRLHALEGLQRSRIEDRHRLTHETQYLPLRIVGFAEVEATTRPDPAASFSKSP